MTKEKDEKGLGFLMTVIIVLVVGAAWHFITHHNIRPSKLQATVLEHPRTVSPFYFHDTNDGSFTEDSLRGQWTFVFFGFTRCPQLCPTAMHELSEMVKALEKSGYARYARVVMVSLDPENDNKRVLGHYVKSFHPSFVGAYGSTDQLTKLTKQLGVVYLKTPNSASLYDHSGTVLLFDPKGELLAFFTAPHKGIGMAKDFELIVQSFG